MPSGASGPRALFGGTGRAMSLEVASCALTKKNSEAPKALREVPKALRALFLGRSGSILGPADAPGLDFGGQNGSIFEVCRRSCTVGANFVRTQENTVKTGARGTSELSRDKTKATKNRSEGAFEAARCTTGARTAHREDLGASSGRPWDAFGRLLAALGSPGAPQDRLWGGIWASKSHPERVRTRPGNGLGHPKRPKIDFSSIWGGFSSIFRRFSLEPRATKAQKQNLKKESRDPQRTSWLLYCAVASSCSHVFRNDF